jgi:hypothetical protein
MALTRANVETILVKRCGALMTAAGLATTYAGANADLNDPIGYAIRKCGGAVASVAAVADSDLAGISADKYDQLLDLAELRTLESIVGNLDDVNITVGPHSEQLADLSARVQKRIETKRAEIQKEYGIGAGALEAGVIGLDFMQKDDEDDG